jgi:hypothetical protein
MHETRSYINVMDFYNQKSTTASTTTDRLQHITSLCLTLHAS